MVKRLVLRPWYFQNVCYLSTPETSGVTVDSKNSLSLNISIGSGFHPTYFEKLGLHHPTPLFISHLKSMFVASLDATNARLWAPGFMLPTWEKMPNRKSLPTWSLRSTGDVNYSLLFHKLPQSWATSNNTYLLHHKVSWGPLTQGHGATEGQLGCCHLKPSRERIHFQFTRVAIYTPQALADRWPETSVPCHVGFSIGYSQHAGLLPAEQRLPERERGQEAARRILQSFS